MSTKIVWRTPGSDVEHTIPEGAVVSFIKEDGVVECWFYNGRLVCDEEIEVVNPVKTTMVKK